MSRSALTALTVALIVAGAVTASFPFLASLQPSESALNALPQIDIRSLQPGHFQVTDLGTLKAFTVRPSRGDPKVFLVPFDKGVYLLPDRTWNRAYLPCADFGPDSSGTELAPEGIFRCRLGSPSAFWEAEHRWRFTGESLGKFTERLWEPKVENRGDYLVIRLN